MIESVEPNLSDLNCSGFAFAYLPPAEMQGSRERGNMFQLLQHLEVLQLSMATLSIGTGIMLGTFVGRQLPVREPTQYSG